MVMHFGAGTKTTKNTGGPMRRKNKPDPLLDKAIALLDDMQSDEDIREADLNNIPPKCEAAEVLIDEYMERFDEYMERCKRERNRAQMPTRRTTTTYQGCPTMSEDKKQADRYEEIGLDEYGREDPCPPAYREEIDTLRARVTKLKRDAAKLCELEQIRSAERNHALDQRDTLAARVAELEVENERQKGEREYIAEQCHAETMQARARVAELEKQLAGRDRVIEAVREWCGRTDKSELRRLREIRALLPPARER